MAKAVQISNRSADGFGILDPDMIEQIARPGAQKTDSWYLLCLQELDARIGCIFRRNPDQPAARIADEGFQLPPLDLRVITPSETSLRCICKAETKRFLCAVISRLRRWLCLGLQVSKNFLSYENIQKPNFLTHSNMRVAIGSIASGS